MGHFPNYHDKSIVNLMSSVLHAFGGGSQYAPLAGLPPGELTERKNVVLMVLDGFGYEFLRKQEKGIFHKHLKEKITSVFPSTTAAGITSFLTGLAPQQHAVTGWFMYLKEFGLLTTSLRFIPRCGGASLARGDIKPHTVFGNGTPNVFQQIERQSYSLLPEQLVGSEYTLSMNAGSQCLPFTSFSGCLRQILKLCHSQQELKFIYAYWDGIDSLSHGYGTDSLEVTRHYYELADIIESFVKSLAASDTSLIISADHGLIDTRPADTIRLEDHPELQESLTMPLSGESRAPYCYVRPSKVEQFERYVTQHFSDVCKLYRSEELIQKGCFGLFDPNPRLFERIGDYVLLMRENYKLRDRLLGEDRRLHKADHGGTSKAEMYVPLIVINA